jgi:hypothetical protein
VLAKLMHIILIFCCHKSQEHDQQAHKMSKTKNHKREAVKLSPCGEDGCGAPAVKRCDSCDEQYCEVPCFFLFLQVFLFLLISARFLVSSYFCKFPCFSYFIFIYFTFLFKESTIKTLALLSVA